MMAKKTKFDWNDFLRPTWEKLIVFFALFFIFKSLLLVVIYGIITPQTWIFLEWIFSPFSTMSVFIRLIQFFSSLMHTLDLIYWYFLSCLIIWIYNKVKK